MLFSTFHFQLKKVSLRVESKNVTMATMILEYNARNSTVRQLIEGLLSSGLFRVQLEHEKERRAIQKNMRTANKMIADIRAGGSAKYQNMDSFLSTLK